MFGSCASGTPEGAELTDNTVTIQMRDSFFDPDEVTVEAGESVTFRFVNRGKLKHDAFIGDEDSQKEHEEEGRMAGEKGEDAHAGEHMDEDNEGITVEPGDTGRITHSFDEPGSTLIGCHEPGHYAAGMKVTVTIR